MHEHVAERELRGEGAPPHHADVDARRIHARERTSRERDDLAARGGAASRQAPGGETDVAGERVDRGDLDEPAPQVQRAEGDRAPDRSTHRPERGPRGAVVARERRARRDPRPADTHRALRLGQGADRALERAVAGRQAAARETGDERARDRDAGGDERAAARARASPPEDEPEYRGEPDGAGPHASTVHARAR